MLICFKWPKKYVICSNGGKRKHCTCMLSADLHDDLVLWAEQFIMKMWNNNNWNTLNEHWSTNYNENNSHVKQSRYKKGKAGNSSWGRHPASWSSFQLISSEIRKLQLNIMSILWVWVSKLNSMSSYERSKTIHLLLKLNIMRSFEISKVIQLLSKLNTVVWAPNFTIT